jgi:hypothetical protein
MMIFSDTTIHQTVIHKVGNKTRDEEVLISKNEFIPNDEIKDLLLKFFLTPFKTNEYYNFYHESDIQYNKVFSFVTDIFEKPESFYEQSINLTRYLYEQSTHPKVKEGEFYVVYFKDCLVDDAMMDAVGLFKTESKDTFIKVLPGDDNFLLETTEGININKLDKGCLIFNTEKEHGYLVTVVDAISKSSEAIYWKDDFLKIRQREDNFYHTANVIKMCKTFVTEKLPKEFEVSKADQADLLNKSISYFKENDDFSIETFKQEVIAQPELITTFDDYKTEYETDNDIKIEEEFSLSTDAVKKESKILKSIIKLDKNFHVYIHGDRKYITKGYDEATGMHFYQLFFRDEN